MKTRKVGVFDFGAIAIRVGLRSGTGGDFVTATERAPHLPFVQIGADVDEWREVVSIATHELLELSMTLRQRRYVPDMEATSSASYLFVMDHQQMNTTAQDLGFVLAAMLPTLATAWKKWKKEA